MDLDWCLTCSKKTEISNPYCSVNCLNADKAGQTFSSLQSICTSSSIPKSPSILPPRVSIKALAALLTQGNTFPPSITSGVAFSQPIPASLALPGSSPTGMRDRPAMSAPVTHAAPPVCFAERTGMQGQADLPSSSSKLQALSNTFVPPENVVSSNRSPRPRIITKAVTGGANANTPFGPDALFYSISESSDNEEGRLTRSPSAPVSSFLRKPSETSQAKPRICPPDARPTRSEVYRMSTTPGLHQSQLPETASVASSALSRSRKDIYIWARTVRYGTRHCNETMSDDEEEDVGAKEEERCRSRIRD